MVADRSRRVDDAAGEGVGGGERLDSGQASRAADIRRLVDDVEAMSGRVVIPPVVGRRSGECRSFDSDRAASGTDRWSGARTEYSYPRSYQSRTHSSRRSGDQSASTPLLILYS